MRTLCEAAFQRLIFNIVLDVCVCVCLSVSQKFYFKSNCMMVRLHGGKTR